MNCETEPIKPLRMRLTDSDLKTLTKLRDEIEISMRETSDLRFLIKSQEKSMGSLLRGLDSKIRKLGGKPEKGFYRPKAAKDITTVTCPVCGRVNKNFTFGNLCRYCGLQVLNPWKETIKCDCGVHILRKEIEDPAYERRGNMINCPDCEKRFNWKSHVIEPETFGHRVCIKCDMPFLPKKNNWTRQRLCPDCILAGEDSYEIDNPEYQKNYRKKATQK